MSLNTPHKVTLTESQISIILYTLEDYMSKGNTSNDPDLPKEIDNIFEELGFYPVLYAHNCAPHTYPLNSLLSLLCLPCMHVETNPYII